MQDEISVRLSRIKPLRVIANSRFTGHPITVEFTKEALKDLLSLQAKLVTIENIQKTVADYFKVRMADLLSKRRSRSVARPRQINEGPCRVGMQ